MRIAATRNTGTISRIQPTATPAITFAGPMSVKVLVTKAKAELTAAKAIVPEVSKARDSVAESAAACSAWRFDVPSPLAGS